MNVVVVLPTYNERENVELVLDKIIAATAPIAHHRFSYLVVDDTSPDGTATVVKAYAKRNKRVYVLEGKKEGLGKALLRGISYAIQTLDADIVAQLDADLSHDPSVLPKFIKAIDDGADFAVGSRYISGGSIPDNWGMHRKVYSVVGNAIVRLGLGYTSVHDWTGGYRAYKKEFFEKIHKQLVAYRGYVFQIAFLHKAMQMGARVVEVPIHFTDRRHGHSKIAPREYIRNVFEYVIGERYKMVRHGPFGKFLVVGTVGFVINTIGLELFVYLGLNPAISAAIGAEMAIISNFIFNNGWTFAHRKIDSRKLWLKFLQFNATSSGAIAIQWITITAGTLVVGEAWYRIFYLFGVGIGLIWNYTMYSRVIWKKSS